ncbi:MAG: hypothetical protein JSW41_01630 [Candidatus Aenigmatarchaeota archaeon]|nr:MAG: hypothetical protein JSW41_01630 [Candidatus Aenigmarchaeota archaeon]
MGKKYDYVSYGYLARIGLFGGTIMHGRNMDIYKKYWDTQVPTVKTGENSRRVVVEKVKEPELKAWMDKFEK